MEKSDREIRIFLVFHNRKRDTKKLENRLNGSLAGGCVLVVTTDPDDLPQSVPNPITVEQWPRLKVSELFAMTSMYAGQIGSSNELFIKIRENVKRIERELKGKAFLDIDLECADQIQSYTSARLSALYPSHVHLGKDERRLQSLPGNVELSDREKDLLIFFYDHNLLFSKTEVLGKFKEYNSNKYQLSKDKLERNGLIMKTLPPADREVHAGKNPDYFKVTINGLYSALLDKKYDSMDEIMDDGRYYYYTKIDNSGYEKGELNIESEKPPVSRMKIDLSYDPYGNYD
ncbi:hypothetical protein AUP07_0711 [methanogenic archaeon mixed culture ISO4-G1]|nr:hypothetical protein AUP07_0711 [methanogenic archaeon mixed culture ISO4-G1]